MCILTNITKNKDVALQAKSMTMLTLHACDKSSPNMIRSLTSVPQLFISQALKQSQVSLTLA